jgi:5-methylcytosine-specific restriction endonuclease McrA
MRTWIFQGNPKIFDIDGYLSASFGLIKWTVSRYQDQIKPGDSVYIWRSQGDEPSLAGVVAEGTVVETPSVQEDDPNGRDFWRQEPEDSDQMQVKIRLNRIASKREVLKREWMKDDSALKTLLILRQPAGTNFRVEELAASRLGQLWGKTGTDWARDEVVAALHLYEQMVGKPISKIADSEVEQLAQQLGRAPTGVYNKLMNLRSIDPRDERKGFEGHSKVDQRAWNEFFDKKTMAIQVHDVENSRLWEGTVKSKKLSAEDLGVEERRLAKNPLHILLEQYSERPKNLKPKRRSQATMIYDRDPCVVTLRKQLANFRCEVDSCQSVQFRTERDEIFIEVHHLVPLSEGGADTLENTVAVCPTHHRLLHYGRDKQLIGSRLRDCASS